jgi:hypothetical protein
MAHYRAVRSFLAAVALVVLMPCSVASADFFTPDTIQRLAPLLVMYAQEDNGPSSAQWFLDHSRLAFAERTPCASETVYAGSWTAAATRKLGLLVPEERRWQYRTKETLLCHHSGPTLLATDYTRPYDSNRALGLHENEGFFLDADLDHGAIGGMPFTQASNHEFVTQAPIYYDDGELFNENGSRKGPRRAYISYWFFYPFNDAPRVRFLFNHQGDWENMSLLFQRDAVRTWNLEAVSYSAHGAPEPIDASCPAPPAGDPLGCPAPRTTLAEQSRLVGFVANGSHATYPSPGPHRIKTAHGLATDLTSSIASGFSWPTWQNLLPLEAQGWAGFCGAWGQVGKSFLPFRSDRTGPLGPGCLDEAERQRKRGGPRSWGFPRSSPEDRAATPGQAIGVDPLGGP